MAAVTFEVPPALFTTGGVGESLTTLHLAVDVIFQPLRARTILVLSWRHGLQSSQTKSSRGGIPHVGLFRENSPYPACVQIPRRLLSRRATAERDEELGNTVSHPP